MKIGRDQRKRRQHGYTLTEIMIVVALIGLLVVLAIPGFMRVRKLSQGKRIVSDARIIDAAIDAWALEMNKTDGANVDLTDLASYSKTGNVPNSDVLGNAYGIGPVGTNQVRIAPASKSALSGVQIDWAAY